MTLWILPTFGIRAIAEELAEERGGLPEGSDKSDFDLKTLKKKADLGRPDFAGKGDKSFWYFTVLKLASMKYGFPQYQFHI